MLEVDEEPTVVLRILIDPVIERLDPLLLQKADHLLLELTAPFPRDDFDGLDLLVDRLLDHPLELRFDEMAPVVDVVKVQLEFSQVNLSSCGRVGIAGLVQRHSRPRTTR